MYIVLLMSKHTKLLLEIYYTSFPWILPTLVVGWMTLALRTYWWLITEWMFVSPQNSYIAVTLHILMVLGDRAVGRWWGQGSTALTNEISNPIRKVTEFPHSCHAIIKRQPSINQETGPHQTWNLQAPWFWTLQPPEPWEIISGIGALVGSGGGTCDSWS